MVKQIILLHDFNLLGGGISGFYRGFDAHFASRMGYIVIRNIIYKVLYDANKPFKPTNDLTTREKGVIAALSGV